MIHTKRPTQSSKNKVPANLPEACDAPPRRLSIADLQKLISAIPLSVLETRSKESLLANLREEPQTYRKAIAIALGWPPERVTALGPDDFLDIAEPAMRSIWPKIAGYLKLSEQFWCGIAQAFANGVFTPPQPRSIGPTRSQLSLLRKVKI